MRRETGNDLTGGDIQHLIEVFLRVFKVIKKTYRNRHVKLFDQGDILKISQDKAAPVLQVLFPGEMFSQLDHLGGKIDSHNPRPSPGQGNRIAAAAASGVENLLIRLFPEFFERFLKTPAYRIAENPIQDFPEKSLFPGIIGIETSGPFVKKSGNKFRIVHLR